MRPDQSRGRKSATTRHGIVVFVALFALSLTMGCRERLPLTMDTLLLGVAEVEGAERISTKSSVNTADYEGEQVPLAVKSLRRQKILETAYIKYHLALPKRGSYKVKLAIYEDAITQRDTWAKRFPPQVLVAPIQTRDWGDGGFIIPNKSGAFGMGRLYLQVDGNGDAIEVEALLEAFQKRAAALAQ